MTVNLQVIPRKLGVALGGAVFCLVLSGSSKATVVAVVDTGIDVSHPAFADGLWTNPGESGIDNKGRDKRRNGIDDDGNGFIDDVHGWNFVSDSNDLTDRHGHGTHVAGLVLGKTSPIAVATGAKVMALKYYDPGTSEVQNLRNTLRALRYALKMGAEVINYSGGGFGRNAAEETLIREAARRGILFVAAAGNEKMNSDVTPYFPADYDLPNILSVAAVDEGGRLIASSNYGARTVDLAAPGDKILSALPGGGWGRMTGTSQAAAHATAAAVRLRDGGFKPRSPTEWIHELIRSSRGERTLSGKTRFQVRIDPSVFETI